MSRLEELRFMVHSTWLDYERIRSELEPRIKEAQDRWLIACAEVAKEEVRIRAEKEAK